MNNNVYRLQPKFWGWDNLIKINQNNLWSLIFKKPNVKWQIEIIKRIYRINKKSLLKLNK